MLGAQTTRGVAPAECVRVVRSICREAQKRFNFEAHYDRAAALLQGVRFECYWLRAAWRVCICMQPCAEYLMQLRKEVSFNWAAALSHVRRLSKKKKERSSLSKY